MMTSRSFLKELHDYIMEYDVDADQGDLVEGVLDMIETQLKETT